MGGLFIRPATIARADHELFLDLWETQIPWLSTIGSGAQWGADSIRSTKPEVLDILRAWVEQSEAQEPWGPRWCRCYVAELNSTLAAQLRPGQTKDSKQEIPAAMLVLTSKSGTSAHVHLPEQDHEDPFVYINGLMSNRQLGSTSKGAGAALIDFAKDVTRDLGFARVCVDCWSGNDRKLVGYYEKLGFRPLGDFIYQDSKDRPGCVLESRLDSDQTISSTCRAEV